MTKKELIKDVAVKNELTLKVADAVVNSILDTITETTKSEKVSLTGFGTFETVDKEARKARNPKTGEEIDVLAKKAFKFKASNTLKTKINE